jgi:hypothetical protein
MFRIPARDEPDSPWPIFERLLVTHPELATLKGLLEQDIGLGFLMRAGEWSKASGRTTLGMCMIPNPGGDLGDFFGQLLEDAFGYWPDFLIVLNADFWADASEAKREILVFHEALHAGQATDMHGAPRFNNRTGAPIICTVPHDIEEFDAVVRRYGPWKSDVAGFLAAAREYENPKFEGDEF